jgi:PAS domain S-box-containing protein
MELGPATALASALEGLLVVDRAGALTYANPAAERILGRPAAELTTRSLRGWNATAVDGAPMRADELPVLRVIRTGEPSATTEHCVRRPDGTTAVVSHTASLIRDPSGAVEGAVASLVDITERPPTADGDLRTDLTFRAFVERSPDGVALHRHEKVVYANPALLVMLGYDSVDEIVGRSVIEFVHPEDRAIVGERIRSLREHNVEGPLMAERLIRRDGAIVDVEVCSRAIAYEGEATVLAMVVDVSERKRILKELDNTVSMLRATLESTADGILVVDETGRITTYNTRFVEMWRIPQAIMAARDDERAIAFVLDQLVDPPAFLARMRALYADTTADSFDSISLVDGRCYERHSLPQRIGGRTVGRVWSFRDVTARERAEAEREGLMSALAAKHELIRGVVDHAPVGICLLRGPDLVYELVNPMFEQILGKRLRIGRPLAEVAPEATELVAILQHVLATGEPFHSVDLDKPTIPRRDGDKAEVYLWLTYLRVPAPAGDGVLALVVDVSDQVEARRRIEHLAAVAQRQAAELESIHGSMLDGVAVCDAEGVITHVNEASGRLSGMDRSCVVGRTLEEYASLADLRRMDGERLRGSDLPLGRALAGETVVNAPSWSTRTGQKLFFHCNAAPIRSASGEITGAVAVERDVSDIIELDTMRDQFIRVAAHELKTPVAIMKGYADLLLRSSDQLPPALRGGAQAIDRGAKRIDRLVGDLLGVSQLLMGCLELRRENVDLAELVAVVVRQNTATSTKHSIRVEGEPVVVFADRVRLTQVLDTLLDNAIRYSPRGGDIEITVATLAHDATVCVRDHGVGIPQEKQARIFERFYRAHTDTPHDYGGMGVGLYIAREVIAQHGGRMWFESEEGSGSKVCFSLPV